MSKYTTYLNESCMYKRIYFHTLLKPSCAHFRSYEIAKTQKISRCFSAYPFCRLGKIGIFARRNNRHE